MSDPHRMQPDEAIACVDNRSIDHLCMRPHQATGSARSLPMSSSGSKMCRSTPHQQQQTHAVIKLMGTVK